MTTKEEFQMAIEMMNSCNATVSCDCEYDTDDAYYLYYRCKEFIKNFDEYTRKKQS